ncbi:hypothetical protein BD779DRAFT_1788433 [Infundibulicybe gibba]|nr:hypothetical protein BD779DRAFT_1788433 [Infundibulicybe gibba]
MSDSQEDSKVSDASESETWSDLDCSREVSDFWNNVIDGRIRGHIGRAPPPRQYSSGTAIEALDKEQRILEDAMKVIQHHGAMEEQALQAALGVLRVHSIATIQRHRNLLVPVMGLPPEILSRIFVFHAQMEPSWLDAALTSTHVCKRWWEIGRACPELWSHIDYRDCHSTAWMAQMIKRSCGIPLSLTICDRTETGTPKMALVVNNMHRFKSLDLDVLASGARGLFKAFSQPAPLLQRLTLSSYAYSVFAFPPEFLGGSAPNLRHMKLTTTNSYIPWDSTLFAHLVTLDVSGSNGRDTPSFGVLLSALARMRELEILILCDCLPPPAPQVIGWRCWPFGALHYFLRQITINASATMHLDVKCSEPSASKEDVEEFFAVFPSHLHTTPTPSAQALKFTWDDPYDFEVDIWTIQQKTEFKTFQNASIKLNFRWESAHSGVSPLDLTWTCIAALASPQLRSFRISNKHMVGWGVDVWRKLARMVPDLHTLAPGKSVQCLELCKALSPPSGLALADCCFPALSYLELEAPYDHPIPTLDGGESPLSVVLARSLAIRASIGCSTPLLAFVLSQTPPKGWSDPFTDAVPGICVRVGRQVGEGFMARHLTGLATVVSIVVHLVQHQRRSIGPPTCYQQFIYMYAFLWRVGSSKANWKHCRLGRSFISPTSPPNLIENLHAIIETKTHDSGS